MVICVGIDVAKIFKNIKIVKKLVLHMIEILPNVITKLKLYNNAILNKRILFFYNSMKVDPLCLPIFNDAK